MSPAETILYGSHETDAITAIRCRLYFDKSTVIPEVNRVLKSQTNLGVVVSVRVVT